MAKKVPPSIVGNAGLFYVCHKLSTLGWNAMPTSRNARGVDVMCFSLDGKKKLLLQVKSLSKRNPLMLGADLGRLMGDFWIIVVRAYPKTVGDWLILRSLRSKMCLSPSLREVLG
ncbi:MAG: hypothetical protein GXY83_24320 [Rhodopirellula sp.]|nr:hypothetical protein [Rhodopirellula sp.]